MDAVIMQLRMCHWPVLKYCHEISDSGFASFPFLFLHCCSHFLSLESLWFCCHPLSLTPLSWGVPPEWECHQAGSVGSRMSERELHPTRFLWLLVLLELLACLSLWIMDWEGHCVQWRQGWGPELSGWYFFVLYSDQACLRVSVISLLRQDYSAKPL